VIKALGFLIAVSSIAVAGCRALPARVAPDEEAMPIARYGSLADFGGRIEAMLGSGESAHWLLDRNELALQARLALADEAAESWTCSTSSGRAMRPVTSSPTACCMPPIAAFGSEYSSTISASPAKGATC
jgi:hypothetical protein